MPSSKSPVLSSFVRAIDTEICMSRAFVQACSVLKTGTESYGNRVKVKVVKNKVAPPFRVAEFDILYGKGISKSGEIIDLAIARDIIEKSGSWFSYNGERLAQGKDNARRVIEESPELMKEIEEKVRAAGITEDMIEDAFAEEDEDELDIRTLDLEG